jgi:hypothetical protein
MSRLEVLVRQSTGVDAKTTYFCNPKQSDRLLATRECTLFDVNLLEAETVFDFIKVAQARSCPMLVALRIILLETADVLAQLLELLFKIALRLARSRFGIHTRRFEAIVRNFELSLLCRVYMRRGDILTRIRGFGEHSLCGSLDYSSRHDRQDVY